MSYIPWINYSNSFLLFGLLVILKYGLFNCKFIYFFLFSFMVLFFTGYFPVYNHVNVNKLGQPSFLLSIVVCVISAFIVFYNSNFDIMRVFFRGLRV